MFYNTTSRNKLWLCNKVPYSKKRSPGHRIKKKQGHDNTWPCLLVLIVLSSSKKQLDGMAVNNIPVLVQYRKNPNSDETLSLVLLGPCHSMCCNKQGDHSWVRMVPASRHRTRRKSPCAFRVERALHVRPYQKTRCGGLTGRWGNDQADSPDLFAGKTPVHRR